MFFAPAAGEDTAASPEAGPAQRFEQQWAALCGGEQHECVVDSSVQARFGRRVRVPVALPSKGCARFTFEQLCCAVRHENLPLRGRACRPCCWLGWASARDTRPNAVKLASLLTACPRAVGRVPWAVGRGLLRWMDDQDVGAADYAAMLRAYHTVALQGVPRLTTVRLVLVKFGQIP